MSTRRLVPKAAFIAAAGALAMVTSVALAHVTVNPAEAPANSYARLDFRVPHGCDGAPTTAIRIQIPSGVTSVRAENKPGWTVDTVVGPLDEPYNSHGETVTEGVTEVSWSGGSLPDHLFEDFGLSVRLPDRPGETIYFPVIQECEDSSHAWIQVAGEGEDPHDLDEPAPALRLTDAGSGHGHGSDAGVGAVDASEGDSGPTIAAQSTSTGTSNVAWIALGVAALAVALGGMGFVLALRRS